MSDLVGRIPLPEDIHKRRFEDVCANVAILTCHQVSPGSVAHYQRLSRPSGWMCLNRHNKTLIPLIRHEQRPESRCQIFKVVGA